MGDTRYRIDSSRIIFEQFEDESVLVDVESGFYYSLSGSGPEFFELIRRGYTASELAARVSQELGVAEAEVRAASEGLIRELKNEGVLLERTGEEAPPSLPEDGWAATNGRRFVPPQVTRYSDMRELLLLDPIHEIDERFGWPTMGGRSASDVDARALLLRRLV